MNIVKNGTDYKGKQKFHCLDCDAYGTLEPQSRSYLEFVKEFVLRAYWERASMRGVERTFGIARQTCLPTGAGVGTLDHRESRRFA